MDIEINRLFPVVSTADRGARQICRHDAHGLARHVVELYEPDVSWAEHGVSGGQKFGAEGVEGDEILIKLPEEIGGRLGYRFWIRIDAGEKEMVVPGHAGYIEFVGMIGVAGEVDDEGFQVCMLSIRTCVTSVNLTALWMWERRGVPPTSAFTSSTMCCWY